MGRATMTSDPFPSPEAIEDAARDAFWTDDLGGHIKGGWTWDTIPDLGRANYRTMALAALAAAVKAQPVVALPPCPTCEGDRSCVCGGEHSDGRGDVIRCYVHGRGCFDCKGSGVDRLVPGSEIREWIAEQRPDPEFVQMARQANDDYSVANASLLTSAEFYDGLARWLDEWEARQ